MDEMRSFLVDRYEVIRCFLIYDCTRTFLNKIKNILKFRYIMITLITLEINLRIYIKCRIYT